jgi:hypothetical protein
MWTAIRAFAVRTAWAFSFLMIVKLELSNNRETVRIAPSYLEVEKMRRSLKLTAWVVAPMLTLVLASKFVEAGDPPTAYTTTSSFIDDIVGAGVSDATEIDIKVDISDRGTHYKYKIGLASNTDCTSLSNYSDYIPKDERLIIDISSYADGPFVLCLLGYKIQIRRGEYIVKAAQTKATVYSWTKSTNFLDPPGNFTAQSGQDTEVPLSWTEPTSGVSYLLVRRVGSAVTWLPEEGQSYSVGDLDGDHSVIFSGTDLSFVDTDVINDEPYFYAVFALDSDLFYSDGAYAVAVPSADGTGSGMWSDEMDVLLFPDSHYRFAIAMNGLGGAMAVATGPLSDYGLAYSIFDGVSWSDGADVPDSSPHANHYPVLRSDRNGDFFVLLADGNRPDVGIHTNFYRLGIGWDSVTEKIDITYPMNNEHINGFSSWYNHDAAFSADGTVMAVWKYNSDPGGTNESWVIARRQNGTGWEDEDYLGTGVLPVIAGDNSGNFMAVYVKLIGPDAGMMYYNYFMKSIGWLGEARLNQHSNVFVNENTQDGKVGLSTLFRVVSVGAGKFVAVYVSTEGSSQFNRNVYGRYFNGTDWEAEMQLNANLPVGDVGYMEGKIDLAGSQNGSAAVIWPQFDGVNSRVYGAYFDGIGWVQSATTEVSYPLDSTYDNSRNKYGNITLDATGNGVATFYQYVTGNYEIVSVPVVDQGFDLSKREIISTPYDGVNEAGMSLGGEASGKAVLLWNFGPTFEPADLKAKSYNY